ncbi:MULTISPECIES: molybdopterin oxidoreductase family protein [Pseudanabaena]|jgi:ferredoxin-nitrate reductase|uniref:molybdopterin oxidoreductase family protein n=1 Tax=Pseudanabaena TaxID=1152 RepID=UPI00247974F9|nr:MULTISPECIES: nitrate reductase [Pseudanabaena]MEA5485843.1 nitrate reductase [Pseudanabaena sp. CCNP1317]WGS72266.1 nitrate reductase [Pseudanabaena galeata CCNP1313]
MSPMPASTTPQIVKTLCPYCGVGCGLEIVETTNQPTAKFPDRFKVRGDRSHPSSQGMVCVKGATIAESIQKDRLLHPMMRDRLDDEFRQVSWDEALDAIVKRMQQVIATKGADALCMYGSGQFQTEDYYIAQKLFKGCLGTNNFDANSRLCMSSAVSGYVKSFGSDGPPCCYEDLDVTDCLFAIGTNTAECHPIIFNRFRRHHKKNPHVKLVVVDPRRTQTAEVADLHLAIQPGTDIDLLNGIAHLLLQWGKCDRQFIDQHTNGFAEFAEITQLYTPEFVARRCGINVDDLELAAKYWAESPRVLSIWSMGVNQSTQGTAKVQCIINLHLLTAQIGKAGAGPFSLTGQPNAMGGREAGGLAHLLPGYRFVTNPQHRAELETFWGLPSGQISAQVGRTAWDMVRGLENDEVDFLWIAATNPAVSFPDLERTKAALRRSPFTVYQDAYYPIETSAYAHLLLPATQWSEKTGTMTNSERCVTLCQAFQTPLGEARDDWAIFAEVGRRLGFNDKFQFQTSAEVHAEFVQITRDRPCDMTGISHAKLVNLGVMQWQASDQNPEQDQIHNKRLYTDLQFHTSDRKARFGAYHSQGVFEIPDEHYPFILTTGRLYGHWHTQTRTGRIDKIRQMHPNPFVEIHPKDANKFGINNGDLVEVRSRRGSSKFPAMVTEAIARGVLFVPMHWGMLWADNAEANALTHPEADPDSKQPELKACAVAIVLVN